MAPVSDFGDLDSEDVLSRWSDPKRYWALPFAVALYRPKKLNDKEGRRHKTPADLMRQLLVQVLRWFPDSKIVFCGDQGFAKHEIAKLGKRSKYRLVVQIDIYFQIPETSSAKLNEFCI